MSLVKQRIIKNLVTWKIEHSEKVRVQEAKGYRRREGCGPRPPDCTAWGFGMPDLPCSYSEREQRKPIKFVCHPFRDEALTEFAFQNGVADENNSRRVKSEAAPPKRKKERCRDAANPANAFHMPLEIPDDVEHARGIRPAFGLVS